MQHSELLLLMNSYLAFPKGEPKVKNALRYLFVFFVVSHKSFRRSPPSDKFCQVS